MTDFDPQTHIPTCPSHLYPLLALFAAHGEHAYPVGGCVRDILRGVQPQDWDVAVTTAPDATVAICEAAGYRTVPTGIKHGTVTVLLPLNGDPADRDGAYEPVECTTCRTEGSYSDGRHPDSVAFTDRIEDDLSRRDFTINAMALTQGEEPDTLTVLDPFGGQTDLTRGIIRCVGDPDTRFAEDALRMLRAVRFAVRLGFAMEEETRAAIQRQSEGLSRISRERIGEEFGKILCSSDPERGVVLLRELGLLSHVLPASHDIRDAGRLAELPAIPALRLACLLRHAPAEAIEGDTAALRLPNAARRDVRVLTHACTLRLPVTPRGAREWRHINGALAVPALLVCLAGTVPGTPAHVAYERLLALVERSEASDEPVNMDHLAIGGRDLIALGFKPGRLLQDILCDLLELVWEDPEKNTYDELINEAEKRKD